MKKMIFCLGFLLLGGCTMLGVAKENVVPCVLKAGPDLIQAFLQDVEDWIGFPLKVVGLKKEEEESTD